MYYWFVRGFWWVLAKCFCRFQVTGRELLPKDGGLILAANHVSYTDPLFLGAAFPRVVHYVAKGELFRSRPLGVLLKWLYAFPVDRDRPGAGTIWHAMRLLRSGEVVALFPEGSRGAGDQLGEAKEGAGYLAARSGCPVVPVYIRGSAMVMPRGSRLPRPSPVSVHFGPPIRYTDLMEDGGGREAYRQFSEVLMRKIAELKAEVNSEKAL